MIIKRELQTELIQLMKEYSVVTITGPRQSGKTTLSKMVFPNYQYCNLENPEVRLLAENDPKAFFSQYSTPLIIDEIQRVPHLLSYIQVIVDENKSKGLFLLTGSHQLTLSATISQSLAGRTALLRLLPLTISELSSIGKNLSRDEYIFNGFLPGIYDNKLNPTKAYSNYFHTYVERDVRQLMQIKNLTNFENFIRLLAGRVGQILNLNSLSRDLGVSSTTLSEWLSILEASYIVFRLNPYFKNLGKRIIKSPKLFFTDVGLVSYLLGIEKHEQVSRDPLLGGLFENMVVMELVKKRLNQGLEPNMYYYRDSNNNEVDIIYQKFNELIPIEIKSAMTYNDNFSNGISYFEKTLGTKTKGFVIYSGDMQFENDNMKLINFSEINSVFM